MRKKVTVVGGGFVGSTTAQRIVDAELADVVLTDILEGVPAGKALDMLESTPISRSDAAAVGISTAAGDYKETANSDIVVVTAGFPRKPGMSRDDLIQVNVKIVKSVCEEIKRHAPNSIVIVVSNPLDAMVYTAWKVTGFPTKRIMGQAGALDVARFRQFIAMELGVSVEDISALLLGGHGDDMVPLPRLTSVHGIPLTELMSAEKITACVERAKAGGGEIVKLMGTSAYYAPASGTIQMVEAIVKDKKRIIPSAAYCENEFGVAPGQKGKGYFVGVPALLGSKGVEKIVTFKLMPDEQRLMDESISHVKDLVGVVRKMFPDLA